MKDDIYLLGDDFKREISACESEENSLRKIEARYKEALSILKSNNEIRTKVINEIRLNKIHEIDDELKKSNLELKELLDKLNSILFAYCNKNGHRYILISSTTLGVTGAHGFTSGFEKIVNNTHKCTVCGGVIRRTETVWGYYSEQKYVQKFPDDIYDDKSITTEDGKTFRMVQEEISKMNEYINYLESLKLKLCELFGHDATMINYVEDFKCNCCGKIMGYQEYINSHHKAKYRGIVDFYYRTLPENDYIISSVGELDLSLPTFSSYQKTLTPKKNRS